MKRVDICDMKLFNAPEGKLFRLRANGIQLQVTCTLKEWNEDFQNTIDKVNENFRNSIRYIKVYNMQKGGKKKFPKKLTKKDLDKWTSTDTGIAVKAHKLPVPEFQPFHFD